MATAMVGLVATVLCVARAHAPVERWSGRATPGRAALGSIEVRSKTQATGGSAGATRRRRSVGGKAVYASYTHAEAHANARFRNIGRLCSRFSYETVTE